ncbi:unnamed protein product [Sphagnum tenellum]
MITAAATPTPMPIVFPLPSGVGLSRHQVLLGGRGRRPRLVAQQQDEAVPRLLLPVRQRQHAAVLRHRQSDVADYEEDGEPAWLPLVPSLGEMTETATARLQIPGVSDLARRKPGSIRRWRLSRRLEGDVNPAGLAQLHSAYLLHLSVRELDVGRVPYF